MYKDILYNIVEPGFIFTEMNKGKFDDLLNEYRFDKARDNVVILLRGANMRSLEGLFQEFAAAFQFPSYFGENWNALDECIHDLDWLSGDNYIIGINDIQDLLINEEKGELDVLFKILKGGSSEWGMPKDIGQAWGRQGKPFHWLLQYDTEDATQISQRFTDYMC